MATPLIEALALGTKGVISLVGAGGKTSLMFRLAQELSAAGHRVLTTTTTKIRPPTEDQSQVLLLSPSATDIIRRARRALKHNRHMTAVAAQRKADGKLIGFSGKTIDLLRAADLFTWIIVEADGAARRSLKAPAAHEPVIPACTEAVVGIAGLSVLGQPLDEKTVFRPQRIAAITGLAPGGKITIQTIHDLLLDPDGIFKSTPPEAQRIALLSQADTPHNLRAGKNLMDLLQENPRAGLGRVVLADLQARQPVLAYRDLEPPEG